MTPEGRVKMVVTKVLKSFTPVWYFMPVQSGYGKMGAHDYIVCANGHFLTIECKAGRGQLTQLQQLQLSLIKAAKGNTLVIRSIDEAQFLGAYLVTLGCREITP